jgi:hypothetical protein
VTRPGTPGTHLWTAPPRAGPSRVAATLAYMDKPAPDPERLLAQWMEWERGDVTPGRAMANLKTGGLRDVLEQLVAATSAAASEQQGASA